MWPLENKRLRVESFAGVETHVVSGTRQLFVASLMNNFRLFAAVRMPNRIVVGFPFFALNGFVATRTIGRVA